MATKKRGKKRSSARRGGKRRRKSYGTVRLAKGRAKRRRYRAKGAKVTLTKRGRRSKRRVFRLKNPFTGFTKAQAKKARKVALHARTHSTVVSSGLTAKQKRSAAAFKAARTRKRRKSARRASSKRSRRRKSRGGKRRRSGGKRRGSRRRKHLFTGAKAHITLRRRKKYPKRLKAALARRGFITKNYKLRNPARRRRHKNPGPGGIVGMLIEKAKSTVTSPRFWYSSAHVVLGGAGAAFGPAVMEHYSGGRVRNAGPMGVLLSGVSAGLLAGVGAVVEHLATPGGEFGLAPAPLRGLGYNLALGGGATTLVRAAFQWFPQIAEYLKLTPVRTPVIGYAAPMAPAGPGAHGMGGFAGFAGVPTNAINEQLIAGESFARSVSQFNGMGDWMELKGMGDWMELKGMGGDPRVPMSSIRRPNQLLGMYPGQYGGGGGFGDMIETSGDGFAMADAFEPALETF